MSNLYVCRCSEFLTDLEVLVNEKLKAVGVLPEAWESSMLTHMQTAEAGFGVGASASVSASGPDCLSAFVAELRQYEDFYGFGEMMEDHCTELYGTNHQNQEEQSPPEEVVGGIVQAVEPPSTGETASVTEARVQEEVSKVAQLPVTASDPSELLPIRFVRVLWDIENIPPRCPNHSKGRGLGSHATETVLRLERFLVARGLAGPGIDTRITTFVNFMDVMARRDDSSSSTDAAGVHGNERGGLGAVSKHVLHDLDKANVEIVFASKWNHYSSIVASEYYYSLCSVMKVIRVFRALFGYRPQARRCRPQAEQSNVAGHERFIVPNSNPNSNSNSRAS